MNRFVVEPGLAMIIYRGLICITVLLAPAVGAQSGESCLTQLCSERVISLEQVEDWHRQKASFGPTFAGTTGWQQFMGLVEDEIQAMGMVDLRRNTFEYGRWYTTEWPDRSGWSLRVGERVIDVAHYGANSGSTGPEGITAPVVHLDGEAFAALPDPSVLAGKILVLSIAPTDFQRVIPDWLYAPPEFPYPVGHNLQAEETISSNTVSQLFAANLDGKLPFPSPHFLKLIKQSRAAGVALIFDMADERVQGLYSFPVPAVYDVPTLYLGREAGRDLLSALEQDSLATLTLNAQMETVEAYQLTAILPGRHYGTDQDELVLMVSHTDGPSISQENGPLGLLAILRYFASVDPALRDKSLMLFLDSRHFIPDREAALPDYDIQRVLGPGGPMAPEHGRLVASVHLEHLGQKEYAERAGKLVPTGRPENGGYYVTAYRGMIDIAERSLRQHQPLNQVLRATDIPGIHGKPQGHWFGLGHHPRRLGIEAIASNMVSMGAYWSTTAGYEFFDAVQFIRQVNVMTQITGELMEGEVQQLLAEPLSEPSESH